MKKYNQDNIQEVIDAFNHHEILAFPTDTVYGVGVKFGNLNDLNRLKKAKNRVETKPIPVMVSTIEQLESFCQLTLREKKIISLFLPGALTLILPLKEGINKEFTNGNPTIAIRMPEDDFVLNVISQTGPLFVTSANQSGQATSLTYEDALEQLPNIDGIVFGKCKALQASTIVDCTKEELAILRQGPISLQQLNNAIKKDI